MSDQEVPVITPQEVRTIYKNKKTGETYETREGWEAKGYKNEEMAQDVKVIMPPLDLLSKTK